ncbi:antibiotic biosynthesis monooxygenase [bacterium]|nr:antibiotic biosynthesis monooxygenase [bacterium]
MATGGVWVVVHVRAAKGKEKALGSALASVVEPTRREPGCVSYDLRANVADPSDFVFLEQWTGEAALDAHMKTPHVTACLAAIGPLLAGPPDIRRYRPV